MLVDTKKFSVPFAMLLVHVVLATLAAIAAIAVIIKHVFLLPLDEALRDTQQVCFESPNSITPVVVRRRYMYVLVIRPPPHPQPPSLQAPSLLDAAPPSKSLSVVIPAYNEELRLPATLEETMRYLQQRRAKRPTFTYEVIVVDDGSTDSTSEVAFEYVKKHGVDAVRLLTLRSNKGKGYAVKAGIMCSRGKNILFMDADGATAIEEVEKLEKKLQEGLERDERPDSSSEKPRTNDRIMVVGSRAHMQLTATAKRCVLFDCLFPLPSNPLLPSHTHIYQDGLAQLFDARFSCAGDHGGGK